MRRLLCCLLATALMLSLFTACGGGKPAPILEGDADGLSGYLAGRSNEDYMLNENAELDLTGVDVLCDRTVILREGVTLKLTGTFTPGRGSITILKDGESGGKYALDLSWLIFEFDEANEATLFEIRREVELTTPQAQEGLFVDMSGDEWISIKSVIPQGDGN